MISSLKIYLASLKFVEFTKILLKKATPKTLWPPILFMSKKCGKEKKKNITILKQDHV